jgi:arylformamidase
MTSTSGPGRPELIDLSHTVHDGLVTYPGLPAPVITDHLSRQASRGRYADGVEFQIGRIEMVANTGTYLDAPFHRFPDGADLAALPLPSLAALPGVLADATGATDRGIGPAAFQGLEVGGRAVLVRTGWDVHWGTDRYGDGNPFLTEAAARHLAGAGAALVGIDSLNIDDPADGRRPAHSILLEAGIPIVEHLCNLDAVGERPFTFFAVPVKVRGMGSFPVRAFALRDPAG